MPTSTKPPIVLVHGAWHGGWCWKRVVPRLAAAGHDVFTPTLTGLGDRAHLFRPDIGLDDHVADVVGLVAAEELSDVVLVGHSYAGMVISGVAERASERIRRLVYLDAFVPADGQSLAQLVARRLPDAPDGRLAGYPPEFFGITDPADAAWVARRLVGQPVRTMTGPIALPRNAAMSLARSYIYCSGRPMGSFDQFKARFERDPAWRYHDLATGHDAMVTDPAGLAEILLAEAAA